MWWLIVLLLMVPIGDAASSAVAAAHNGLALPLLLRVKTVGHHRLRTKEIFLTLREVGLH